MNKKFFLLFVSSLLLASCNVKVSSSSNVEDFSSSHNDGGGSSSSSSSSSSIEYERKTYKNPIKFYRQDGSEYFVAAADPDVIYGNDGYYYLYITNASCEMGDKAITFDRGPIFRSKDLTGWTWCGSVFEGQTDQADWGSKDAGVWAPHVVKVGDHWNYYYSLSSWGDSNPGIGVATSPTPYGPWTHYGKLLDQNMTGVRNGIDPYVAYDGDELYIFWGSFFGVAATRLTDDGTELFYADQVKEHLTWVIPDNRGDKSMDVYKNYEGTFIIEKDGKYFFFGSQGTCLAGNESTYTVKTGKADSIFGPYYGSDGNDLVNGTYGDVVVEPSSEVGGTGHNTVIQDFNGDYWLIYHGYDINSESHSDERQLFMDKLLWDSQTGLPYVEGKKASVNKDITGPLVIK